MRELARELGSGEMADKHDSQDICFVPQGKYADVIRRLHPEAVAGGEIVDLEGRVLGRHEGIVDFTVGQRRGLGIAAAEPLYVVQARCEGAGSVVVGPREALRTHTVRLRDVNWLGDRASLEAVAGGNGVPIEAKVRSSAGAAAGEHLPGCGTAEVQVTLVGWGIRDFARGRRACSTPTTAEEAEVLGGGFIAEAVPAALVA